MGAETDRRRAPRVAVNLATVVQEDRCVEADPARLLDLSLSGAFLETQFSLERGKRLRILLRDADGKSYSVPAYVVRQHPRGIGVRFLHMEDATRRFVAELAGVPLPEVAPLPELTPAFVAPVAAPPEPPPASLRDRLKRMLGR